MLSYRHPVLENEFRAVIKAARLVPSTGTAGLPAPFGNLSVMEISSDPTRLGLPGRHPLQELYPGLVVKYSLLVVPEHFKVERGGVRGVSLYVDYRGSNICASITSEMGRNAVAPWNWEGELGSPTDATATTYMEWRRVEEDGRAYWWQNHMVHGVKPKHLDWRDGVPVNLHYMHDPTQGEVLQSILVPVKIPGLGNAEQTIPADALTSTYSVLVYFPKQEYAQLVQMAMLDQADFGRSAFFGLGGGDVMYKGGEPPTRGLSIGASRGGEAYSPSADYKMASGGRIRQHIIADPFGPFVWDASPAVLFVCIPVGEEQASHLLRSDMPSNRRTF